MRSAFRLLLTGCGMELRTPREGERAHIRALLVDSGLPVEDLDASAINFIVAVEDDRLLGVVGIEAFQGAGLLRSLAVQGAMRGTGTGVALVQAAESHARSLGVKYLVLLTQTAAPFFLKHGYDAIERHDAPSSVQGSAEFRSICPASATCMIKHLRE